MADGVLSAPRECVEQGPDSMAAAGDLAGRALSEHTVNGIAPGTADATGGAAGCTISGDGAGREATGPTRIPNRLMVAHTGTVWYIYIYTVVSHAACSASVPVAD